MLADLKKNKKNLSFSHASASRYQIGRMRYTPCIISSSGGRMRFACSPDILTLKSCTCYRMLINFDIIVIQLLDNPLKPLRIRTFLYKFSLLISVAVLLASCKGELLSPANFANADTSLAGGGGTTKPDTLPNFNLPASVALDASRNIYVADWGNNLIREITTAGVVSTYAGSGFAGYNNGTGLLASFNEPTGLAIDASGNLFVADAGNNLIRKISNTAVVTTIAGSDTTGYADGVDSAAVFFNPLAVAVDGSDNVYVADAGNDVIRMVTSGGVVSTFAGQVNTSTNTSASPFSNPSGIALAPTGNLFVANYLDNNILQVSQSGTVTQFAGTDSIGSGNGPALSATFYYPNSVIVDANNNIYVSDGINNVIRKISSGTVSTFAGSGIAGAIDGTGVNASFNGPAGLAVDALGNIYVADSNNNEIRKITPAGVVTTIAGTGIQGSQNGTTAARRNTKPLKVRPRPRVDVFRPRFRRLVLR
jgi:sugar lactone lactonase YvrE